MLVSHGSVLGMFLVCRDQGGFLPAGLPGRAPWSTQRSGRGPRGVRGGGGGWWGTGAVGYSAEVTGRVGFGAYTGASTSTSGTSGGPEESFKIHWKKEHHTGRTRSKEEQI